MNKLFIFSVFIALTFKSYSQENFLVVSKNNLDESGVFRISQSDKWLFKKGHDTGWSKPSISTSDWQRLRPADISSKIADKNGRVEGWFRLKFRLDSTMAGIPLWLNKHTWAAAEIYLDGRLIQVCGNTGANGQPFTEHVRQAYRPSIAIQLIPDQTHQLSIHLVDYPDKWKPYLIFLKYDNLLRLVDSNYIKGLEDLSKKELNFKTFWLSVDGILAFLLVLLSLIELNEKRLIRSLMATIIFSVLYVFTWFLISFDCTYNQLLFLYLIADFAVWGVRIISLIALFEIIGFYPYRWLVLSLIASGTVYSWLIEYTSYALQIQVISVIVTVFCLVYVIIVALRRPKGVLWLIIIGISIGHLVLCTEFILILLKIPYSYFVYYSVMILSVPLSFIIYLTIRIKDMIREIKENARKLIQASQEKQQILATQNELLEQQVEARTAELKASQAQLIQKEKLASLGELTAGIAHEIQNPLNFVNNFSEVSTELALEMEEELSAGNTEIALELAGDIRQNLQKINHHGQRASAIVKGMLEHSRATTGERQLTDINKLADEYLRLSYHGIKAKESSFEADYKLIADENLPLISVVPQEIGRVLLNLTNNAFYAVHQRTKSDEADYQPKVTVRIQQKENQIQLSVQDNGNGIPAAIKDKIFQPFFTTKPTGEGTGLGLSLSYDIITKGHGGTIEVVTKEGEGTTFKIILPL